MVMKFFKPGLSRVGLGRAYLCHAMPVRAPHPSLLAGYAPWFAALLSAACPARSQGCDAMPPVSDFQVETLSADAPGNAMDLAVAPDLKVFWVERYGNLKVYDPATKATRLIQRIDVMYDAAGLSYLGGMETGLEGIALDGDFASNHWIYLWYALPAGRLPAPVAGGKPGPVKRLSRFTLTAGDTQLDMASEKPLFEQTVFAQCCHYGGDLDWGPDGNLWLGAGDNMQWTLSTDDPFREADENTDVRRTAGNTNDTRGKILRIRPIPFPDSRTPAPGAGSTYTIPEGNLRDYFGGRGFWSASEQALVRPEIYSMGHRNPFSLAVHPVKLYPADGEAGWDNAANGEDEINIMPHPQNNGWPFFNGGNYDGPQKASLTPKQPPSAPMNLSKWNTGVQKLPPAVPAALSNRTAAIQANLSCVGTVLAWAHYDPALDSRSKFPPYLDGKLLISSLGSVPLQAATVDDSGRITRLEQVLPPRSELSFIFRAETGPDGAIYIARGEEQYGTAPTPQSRIVKLSYKGPCAPVVVSSRGNAARRGPAPPVRIFHLGGATRFAWPDGVRRARAYGPDGSLAWEGLRDGNGAEGRIPASVACGLLQLRFRPE